MNVTAVLVDARSAVLNAEPLPETLGLSYQQNPERSGSDEGSVCHTAPAPLTDGSHSPGTFPTRTHLHAHQSARSSGTVRRKKKEHSQKPKGASLPTSPISQRMKKLFLMLHIRAL